MEVTNSASVAATSTTTTNTKHVTSDATSSTSGATAVTAAASPADDTFQVAVTPAQIRVACAATTADYAAVAQGYARGNANHDVSQNVGAALRGREGPLDILDLGCAGGRDVCTIASLGHRVVGVAGSLAFARIAKQTASARKVSAKVDIVCTSIYDLDLGGRTFDVIFANAVLFHLPSAALPTVLTRIANALTPNTGIFFASNAHGFGMDKEGWVRGRTPRTRSYVAWLSEDTWVRLCKEAGLTLVEKFFRPPNRPRSHQPFLATVWRKCSSSEDSTESPMKRRCVLSDNKADEED